MHDRKKRGRPPGGDKPGERVVDYPQLSVRVPRATLRKLRAAATVQRLSQAKVLADAIDRYLDALPAGSARAWSRGCCAARLDVFEQPSKRPNTDRASRADHGAERRRPRGGAVRALINSSQGRLERRRGADRTGRRWKRCAGITRTWCCWTCNLPDINGLEVCRRIKADAADPAHQGGAGVCFRGGAPLDQLHCLEEGGADMYLTEPMARGTLLSVIDRLMNAALPRS